MAQKTRRDIETGPIEHRHDQPTHGWPEDRIPRGATPDQEREVRMECLRLVMAISLENPTAVGVVDSATILSNFVLGLVKAKTQRRTVMAEKNDG